MASLWATEAAFRLLTLGYALFIHSTAVSSYSRPDLASVFIALQCVWTGVGGYLLFAVRRWRAVLVGADQLVTVGLMYATWLVAPQAWWDHNQSLPTTMWAINAVLCAGMMWGVLGGFLSGVALALVSIQVGGDLSWLERSPTIPVFVCAGLAAGFGGRSVRRAHEQLAAALRLRARTAERERLARQVHDGVLQTLALVARRGATLGGEGAELGQLAAHQERALRGLIAEHDEADHTDEHLGTDGLTPVGERDLRHDLLALAGDGVRVSAGSAPIALPATTAEEIVAAVEQVLTNTSLHAGPDATSFVLVEDLGENVVVTVRDDGVGIAPGRLEAARAEGRLGVSGSIVGRIEALGGTAHLESAPDEGVEWEFTVPR